MSEGMNKAILIGNLGMDPELKFTQGGQACLRLRLATTDSYLDKSNERKERTEWHTVIVWGKRGEGLNKILQKGSRIAVEGRIQTRSWDDKKDGSKRYATEINATNVLLCDGRASGGGSARDQERGSSRRMDEREQGMSADWPAGAGNDDDIPF